MIAEINKNFNITYREDNEVAYFAKFAGENKWCQKCP